MADLYPLYLTLRGVMLRAAPAMQISKDSAGELTVNVPRHVMDAKDPEWFGSVRLTGNNVSYYLPPLTTRHGRDLVVSPALTGLMSGRTCFVLREAQPDILSALEDLTRAAAHLYPSRHQAA